MVLILFIEVFINFKMGVIVCDCIDFFFVGIVKVMFYFVFLYMWFMVWF